MITNYIIDASALIAFLNNENGALKVEHILKSVKKDNSSIKMNVVNLNETMLEAGRLKATYRISLADSIALAEAKINNAYLITADHHELDLIEDKKEVLICWIR